jgi:hypothetical protein
VFWPDLAAFQKAPRFLWRAAAQSVWTVRRKIKAATFQKAVAEMLRIYADIETMAVLRRNDNIENNFLLSLILPLSGVLSWYWQRLACLP